jgi:hypothetical protein
MSDATSRSESSLVGLPLLDALRNEAAHKEKATARACKDALASIRERAA